MEKNDETEKKTEENIEHYGYDVFPERAPPGSYHANELGKVSNLVKKMKDTKKKMFDFYNYKSYYQFMTKVNYCLETNIPLKILTAAIKSTGCISDIRNNIKFEKCIPNIHGGYDTHRNEIIVCNSVWSKSDICKILNHEMIHMFDKCRSNFDYTNNYHVACTEIRAAVQTHCSYLAAYKLGIATATNYKKKHRECVRAKAVTSLLAVRKIRQDEAEKVVDSVFNRCYNDLEPYGRIIKKFPREDMRLLIDADSLGYFNDK
ncbi:hypothetical protein A3Q56_03675 [Intoshia linei]|uniref:Mitochondrial inner membrane protease ATP23 n=1 Tax=Intoshia linei TaxID=1819745 RepID=A0A177B2R8_9BILA|nr:hypothetical protein A3Q56_03675 [Intoshia linei]